MTFDAARLKTDLFMAEVKGNFRHARVDLDGDGEPESVLSVREAVGNGLGLEWWRHLVLKAGRPLMSFVTHDYGEAFVAQPRGCALLATSVDGRLDQLRGDGTYWVARLHVLEGDRLRAIGPEVVRRYTNRFATQRGEGLDLDLGPLGVFEPRYGGREEPLAPNHFEYDALLDARTGAPLLQDLRPFGEARWSGRKVTVCEGVAAGAPRVTLRFE